MKCKDCDCCHLTSYTRWNAQKHCMQEVQVYECWGVKETFEIKDINRECTEYPEKRSKNTSKPLEVFKNETNYFRFGTEECGLEITPDDIVFLQKGTRKTWAEMLDSINSNSVCPCCGRKL